MIIFFVPLISQLGRQFDWLKSDRKFSNYCNWQLKQLYSIGGFEWFSIDQSFKSAAFLLQTSEHNLKPP